MATETVRVPGGQLAYEILAGTTEPILAIHGISSQRRLWSWLHAEAPELTLVAPDLRGRADSLELGGPYRPTRHADRHPDRVRSLVLVDGGFPMALPPGLTSENVMSRRGAQAAAVVVREALG